MCRLAAFPPGFKRSEAKDLLDFYSKHNRDGTGSVHVKNGEFVVHKWPLPLSRVFYRHPLLDHMPHNGWTVVHLRAASHGLNTMENTHPFVKGDWAVVHNGIWSEYELVKEALKGHVVFDGETDSEVAAHLLATWGPKKLAKLVDFGGVFMGLKRDGELWVVKTSGDLETMWTKKGMLVASMIPMNNTTHLGPGWYRYDKLGNLVKRAKRQCSFISRTPTYAFSESVKERDDEDFFKDMDITNVDMPPDLEPPKTGRFAMAKEPDDNHGPLPLAYRW